MTLRAVIFDLDDTLLVDEAVSEAAFDVVGELAANWHGADAPRFVRTAKSEARKRWAESPCHGFCRAIGISAFECLWGKFDGESVKDLHAWAHPYRHQVFEAALREQLIEPDAGAGDLAAAFEESRRNLQRLMPDAVETLARLKPLYKLGLLTNGAPDLQREKLAASGLEALFDAVAISGEVGIGKPDPAIFHRLLDKLDARPDEAVMVGNSLERDIAGAARAGIRSIWIRVPGSEEHHDVTPDHTILALAELPPLLEGLRSPKSVPA